MKKILALLAFFGVLFISCSDDDTPVDPQPMQPTPVTYTSGSADFSNYVSVGNSLTAGYSDNALFVDGQTASFPNMLASNFALAGGGAFDIPFMADNLGGLTVGGSPLAGFGNRLFLDFSSGEPNPIPVDGNGSTEVTNILSGQFNNMGIPGAKSYELAAEGYGSLQALSMNLANPYFVRFASSADASVIGDAVAQSPTFFTLWAGNNDVLLYATNGAAATNQLGNLDPRTYARNDMSDPNVVAGAISGMLQALKANGAGGAIANIPDVTSIPYFNTVPHNPVPLDATTAAVVNNAYALYNGGLQQALAANPLLADEVAKRTISFAAGPANAVVIEDEDLLDIPGLPKLRQATADDLLILTARSFIGTLANPNDPTSVNGVGVPLADNWVLTPEEQDAVQTATSAYNQAIEALAAQFDVAFVDANAFLNIVADTGAPLQDGSVVTATYATGGGFSLDGVHPSPRGYALLANLFVEAINAKYGSNLPGVNPLDFKGLYIN